jgi:DNA (cytosine-5)-methyltransferase 1
LNYKLGELFCGPGGLALGAFNAKIDGLDVEISHGWASDYHEETCSTYRMNLVQGHEDSVICADVRKMDLSQLGKIDGFAYGFPCNDFSNIGEKKGFKGEYGPLYSYGVEVLNLYKPKFFVAENVGGLTSRAQEKAFKQIVQELSNAGNGYELTINYYHAEKYGVPQLRHRVILVGIDKTLQKKFLVPAPTHSETNYITCKEALENPPIPEDAPNNELTRQSKNVVERLLYTKPGENAWNAVLPDHLKLNVKGAKLSNIYRRMDPNRPAYTITGSGGGGTHGYHWEENRALTNRERARLQTFPDTFIFQGSKESVRRQIGMAVPPKLAEVIFTALLKTLHDIPYKWVEENIKDLRSKHVTCIL